MEWDDEDDSPLVEEVQVFSDRMKNTDPARQGLLSPGHDDANITETARNATKQTKSLRTNKSHNLVEKRYRANLNQKITELRNVIPCLHSTSATKHEKPNTPAEPEGTQKLNKATVLNKAIEYVQELETRNRLLENNIHAMKQYIDTMKHQNVGTDDTESAANAVQDTEQARDAKTESMTSIQGMIQVPPEIQRLRQHHLQQHFGEPIFPRRASSNRTSDEESEPPPGRLHVGSLVL